MPKGKFRWTLLFWVATSYAVSCMFYTVGSWWWSAFAVAQAAKQGIVVILKIIKDIMAGEVNSVGIKPSISLKRRLP